MSFQDVLLQQRNATTVSTVSSDLEVMYESDIDREIIRERNADVKQIADDMSDLGEISLQIKELVFEQAEDLDIAEENVTQTEENVQQSTQNLKQAVSLSSKLKNIFAKGALVSTGVTGAGAMAGIFLNPIAGGVAVTLGIGGIVFCIFQMV